MRELQIVVTCDLCKERFDEQEAFERTFSWRGVDYAIDVCRTDDETLDELPMSELTAKARKVKPEGKPSGQPTRQTKDEFFLQFVNLVGEFDCPLQGCDTSTPTAQGLSAHFSRIHNQKLREWAAKQKAYTA